MLPTSARPVRAGRPVPVFHCLIEWTHAARGVSGNQCTGRAHLSTSITRAQPEARPGVAVTARGLWWLGELGGCQGILYSLHTPAGLVVRGRTAGLCLVVILSIHSRVHRAGREGNITAGGREGSLCWRSGHAVHLHGSMDACGWACAAERCTAARLLLSLSLRTRVIRWPAR